MIAASQRWAIRLKPAIVRIRQQSTLNEGPPRQLRCLHNENPRTARTFGIIGHRNRGREGYPVAQKSFSSEPGRLKIDGDFFSMKLQIVSDLHLETPKAYDVYEIKPSAPHLALLGDIGCVSDPGYLDFLTAQLAQFRTVFHLLGNHEPYGSTWDAARKTLRAFQEQNRQDRARQLYTAEGDGVGEYVLLDRDEFHLSGHNLTILGCTLFSDVPEASKNNVSFGLNDFFRIGGWTVEQHVDAHRRDVTWLNERVAAISREDPERRIAVLTHHSPTVDARSVNPRHVTSKIKTGFATDLSGEECWRSENVVLWAFGHTHYNFDQFRDENTGKVVYSNQRGYYFAQAPGFDEEDVVDLSDLGI